LRDVKLQRRARDVLGLGDGNKVAKMAQFHRRFSHYLLGLLRQQTSSFTMAWCQADRSSEKRKEFMTRTREIIV
jgi:hypothetical protein